MQKKPYFGRITTDILKGIALILMFLHHFFTFPEYWIEGINYPTLAKLAPYFQQPFKSCVPIFCFITGYFYFFRAQKDYGYSLKKIVALYGNYWGVFALFAVLAVVCAGYRYSLKEILLETLALDYRTMCFCWYVSFYAVSMLLLPLFARILKKNALLDVLICLLILPSVLKTVTYFVSNPTVHGQLDSITWFFPTMLCGYLFAGYNLFERLMERANRIIRGKALNIVIWFLLAGAAMMICGVLPFIEIPFFSVFGRKLKFVINMDVLYAPIIIYCVANLCGNLRCRLVGAVLAGIGRQSMLMWFFHCLFFANAREVFQPILYFPRNPVLVTIWGLALCWGASMLFTYAVKGLKAVFRTRKRA